MELVLLPQFLAHKFNTLAAAAALAMLFNKESALVAEATAAE